MCPQNISLTTKSAEETRAIAVRLAAQLPEDLFVLLLIGTLGSGKTTFVQGLAEGLGINAIVTSPSFLLMKDYSEGLRPMRHVDLYRLSHSDEAASLGLAEDLLDDVLVVVEWADRFSLQIPAPTMTIKFEKGAGENERRLVFSMETAVMSLEELNALCAD